jgi:hypothetical protein
MNRAFVTGVYGRTADQINDDQMADLYLDWINDFVSVDGFAAFYGFSINDAVQVINKGRDAHEARASVTA